MEYNIQLKPKTNLNVQNSHKDEIKPNTGKIITYTSGWPKNQNKC